jgi:hypothetical protein
MFNECSCVQEEIEEVGKYVPQLSQKQKLLYSITRLTLDKKAKDNEVKVKGNSVRILSR